MNWSLKKFAFVISLTITYSLPIQAAKIFVVGGDLHADNTSFFSALIKATGKDWKYNTRSFNNCSTDWSKTTCPKIAVVVSGSESLAEGSDVFNSDDFNHLRNITGLSYYHLFQKWGFSPKQVMLAVDNYKTASIPGNPIGDANIAMIEEADVVYFNGGDQCRHSRAWINTDGTDSPILKALRQRVNAGKVIVSGSSAGMAIQGHTIYGEGNSYGYLTINDLAPKEISSPTGLLDDRQGNSGFQYEYNGGKMKGFGFLARQLAFDTHFDVRARLGRMITAMKNISVEFGIGADENTAIYLNEDEAQVFGEHSVFIADNSTAQYQNQTGHMNVKGIVINLLTDGDRYNFKTRTLISTKPKILTPQYKGNLNDFDILNAYNSTKLITHLINQTENANHGFSEKKTPGVHYVFRKDQKTQGFYDQNSYSAEKVIMDILDI